MFKPRSWQRRILTVAVISVIAYVTFQTTMSYLTEREAARIKAITPTEVSSTALQRLDIERMMADVTWLAASEREGRGIGTQGGLAARQWIAEQFQAIGLVPAGSDGYLQPFSVPEHNNWSRLLRGRNVKIAGIEGAANVLGMLPGTQAGLNPIVITAHYDHLGSKDGKIFHGADDNASGVATMLALARYFQQQPLRHPLLFVALDAEERGLQGAYALFRESFLDPKQLAFNVNVDMLSRDTNKLLYAVGTYQQPWLKPVLAEIQKVSQAKLLLAHDRPWYVAGRTEDWSLSSDHGAFNQHGVPFIYFGVADHEDYHSPRDTADKVDVAFYHQVSETVLSFIETLDVALLQ
ncbi:M28 family peptidase [Pseudoalteromonas fenneropenaei]|uniref:M28 family peptidase n=1 Tax=Pseudoalteromonas fenneropenaei TaxID=1737459 RepID=A0ABV7CDY5_9GAMM